jgi:hypothetical protein
MDYRAALYYPHTSLTYINDVFIRLGTVKDLILDVGFADDLILDANKQETLKEALIVCCEFFKERLLNLSRNKFEVLVISPPFRKNPNLSHAYKS